jgi:hypothetical protein
MSAMREPSSRAVEAAERLLAELGVAAPEEIDVALIAAHCGAISVLRRLENEEGHLLRAGSRALVAVSELAALTREWRFVIAHELGHFLLQAAHDDFARYTGTRRSARRGMESEANDFAAALLMPRAMFAGECTNKDIAAAQVVALADRFDAPLASAALRVLFFATAPCAAACVRDGVIEWCARSRAFPMDLRRGTISEAPIAGASCTVLATRWGRGLEGLVAPDEIVEETIATEDGATISWLRPVTCAS